MASTKLAFVLRGKPPTSAAALSSRVIDELAPEWLAADPARLKLAVTTSAPPRLSVVPFRRQPVALVSLWCREGQSADDWLGIIGASASDMAVEGYRVDESVPVGYERDWPDGQTTPGVGLLTLFRRKPGLNDEQLIARWHGRHTPLTLRIHPVWCYVRNVVVRSLTPGAPPLDGIVEEHFRSRSELLNPLRFFGGARRMLPHMIEVAADIRRFIDLWTIETFLTTELHLRSDGGP